MKKPSKKSPVKKKVAKKKAIRKVVPNKYFVEACKYLKTPAALPIVSGLPKRDRMSLLCYYQITKVIEAENKKNNNWKPDYNNPSQYKYSVYHIVAADEKRPAGFGFSDTNCDPWTSNSTVGSRLLVGNSETALRLGKELGPLFLQWKLFLD